jgi:hypothetical protein
MAKGEKKDDKKHDKKKDKIDELAREEILTRSKVVQASKDYAAAQLTIQENMAAGRKTPQKVFQARNNAEEVLKRYPEHVSPFSPNVRDENRQEYPDEPGEPDEIQVKNTTKTPATNLRGRDEIDLLGVGGQPDYETQRENSRLDEESFEEPGLSDPNNLFFRQLRDEEDLVAPLPNTSIDQLRANAARAQAERVPTTPRLSSRAVGPFTPTVNQSTPPSSSDNGSLFNGFRSSVKKILTGNRSKDQEETLPLLDDNAPPAGGPVDPTADPAVAAGDPAVAADPADPVKPVDPTAADPAADTSFQNTPPDPVQQAIIASLRDQVSRNAQASAFQQAQLDQTRSQVQLLLSKQQTVDQAAITKLELRQELARNNNNNNNERWYPRPGQFSYMDLARQNRFRENYPPGARERYFRNIPARHRPLLQQEEEEVPTLKRPAPELSSNKKRAKVSGKTMSKEKLTALIKLLLSEAQSEKLAQAKKQRKKPVKKNGVRGSLASSHVS